MAKSFADKHKRAVEEMEAMERARNLPPVEPEASPFVRFMRLLRALGLKAELYTSLRRMR